MRILTAVIYLYSWSLAAVITYFLYLIARFFEGKTGQRSYYGIFLVPTVAFVIAALQYALRSNDFVGDISGDALLFAGGLILISAGSYLLRLMIGGKR